MENILVPVSPGEVLDKITILEIKSERMDDPVKVANDIRDKERVKEFDQQFIDLARNVYFTNDRRSDVKKQLNLHLGSQIIEEKSYQDYS